LGAVLVEAGNRVARPKQNVAVVFNFEFSTAIPTPVFTGVTFLREDKLFILNFLCLHPLPFGI
jgi:hypothetical protein